MRNTSLARIGSAGFEAHLTKSEWLIQTQDARCQGYDDVVVRVNVVAGLGARREAPFVTITRSFSTWIEAVAFMIRLSAGQVPSLLN